MHKSDVSVKSSKSVRIIFLYTEVSGYVNSTFRTLANCGGAIEIGVVHWDKVCFERVGEHGGHSATIDHESIDYFSRSSLKREEILDLLHSRNPDIIYISGWVDKGYLWAVKRYKKIKKNVPVVCGIDDQWWGTLRQHLGCLFFKVFYRELFDFMWVSGKPQYHYAQRFGYGHERIIENLYSADAKIFNEKMPFSRRLVFVGRLCDYKALDQLVDAYGMLPEHVRKQWPLVLIGDGPLKAEINDRKIDGVTLKGFMTPSELGIELAKGGVGCIPSHYDQWGVAIHEMAILGYPLIVSSACGAATEFLISGYNGFLSKRSNTESLHAALLKITMLEDDELELFSQRSHELGARITPEHAAYSLLSVLHLSEL